MSIAVQIITSLASIFIGFFCISVSLRMGSSRNGPVVEAILHFTILIAFILLLGGVIGIFCSAVRLFPI